MKAFTLYVVLLLSRAPSAAADLLDPVVLAPVKTGDKIAVFLPQGSNERDYCDAVGASGRVYWVSVPEAVAVTPSCRQSSSIELQPRKISAPELYNSSDDPGVVYEYYTTLPPMESFVAPEPLDLVAVVPRLDTLMNAQSDAPNLQRMLISFFDALRPGGTLLLSIRTEDKAPVARLKTTRAAVSSTQQQIASAGFVLVDRTPMSPSGSGNESQTTVLRLQKPR